MTTIGFIRHGITEWNHLGKAQGVSDIPLNEVGKQQAFTVGKRLLQEEKWDVMISSDLCRAKETAEIIGSQLNLPLSRVEKRVREINCGKIEGTTEEERVQMWGHNWRELDLGMEKREDVSKRSIELIEELSVTHKGKRILIVSHGALIGLTLQKLFPDKYSKTFIHNTSLTVLENRESKWDCILYNCTKHLDSF